MTQDWKQLTNKLTGLNADYSISPKRMENAENYNNERKMTIHYTTDEKTRIDDQLRYYGGSLQ